MLYAVLSFAAVICLIALYRAQSYFKMLNSTTYQYVTITFLLSILTPILVSILFFIKILLQQSISVPFSRVINMVATILFVIGAPFLLKASSYNLWYLLHFVLDYPMYTFIFYLQLCSFGYDLFSKRKPGDCQPE